MNEEVLAIRAALAKASAGASSGFPTADKIDSIAYGKHTRNVERNVAKNIIQPVCIDFFLAATRCIGNCAYAGPHGFCGFIAIFRSSCDMAA